MLVDEDHHPGLLPVQQLRPGDHAFLGYDGDAPDWDVLAAFVWAGLARGEKVMLFGPPQLGEAGLWSRLQDVPGPLLRDGRETGRLTLGSMRSLILPNLRFTADRQWQRLRQEAASARSQGFTGLRAYIDMGWVADLGADLDAVMDRERRAEHLFAEGFYSEICAYERQRFPVPVLEAMSRAHPRNVLPVLGQLKCAYRDGTLRAVGEADVATHEQFAAALTAAHRRTPMGGRLVIDLQALGFLGVECAGELVRLRTALADGQSVRIRCRAGQAALLTLLGLESADIDVSGDGA